MEKQSQTRGPMGAPKLMLNLPVDWDKEARSIGYNNDIIQQFIAHVAGRVVAMDPSAKFVVRRRNEMDCDGYYLARLVRHTTLNATIAEDFLDDATAEALDTFGVPSISVAAAME